MAFYTPPTGSGTPSPKSVEPVDKLREDLLAKLAKVSGLSKEEAKDQLLAESAKYYAEDLSKQIEIARQDFSTRAKELAESIIVDAMVHGATEYTAEYTVSTIPLTSDSVKGSIIGQGGRNIAAFEKATGVEIEIEEGNSLKLSSFDSLRREVARRALEILIKDGRITPTRIEEVVSQTKRQLDLVLMDEGRKICSTCGVFNLDPELVRYIGRYRFRFSYGQNLGIHTIEETKIGVQIALELGLSEDTISAIRLGCLLHDIGKVVTDEEGTHVQLGVQLLKKFNLSDLIVSAVAEHHEDKPFSSVVSRIVWVADAISGSRPGARYEPHEAYVKRLTQIESVARVYPEVAEVYAFQAGRDVRVIVRPEAITDAQLSVLVAKIRADLEKQVQYVGQIRVTAVREVRASDITKAK